VRDYLLWSGLVAVGCGVCTAMLIAGWDRWVRRETAAARALAEAREAAFQAQQRREQDALEALAASERRHRALAQAGAIAVWRAAPDGRLLAADGWTALTGQPVELVLGQPDGWLLAVVPEDRERAASAWAEALDRATMLDVEVRLVTASGGPRWCRVRVVALPLTGQNGEAPGVGAAVAEWVGMVEDVHERRRLEESRLLLSREINHRARNLLAVVQAVVRMTPVGEAAPPGTAASLSARIAALGRAHDLLAEREWRGADLVEVARGELAAWLGAGMPGAAAATPRVRVTGPPLPLAATAVQPLAMVLHELATNAAKHGALSGPEGRVVVTWRQRGDAQRIVWAEWGGPVLEAGHPPRRRGFGTRVVDASVRDQLGGQVRRRWCRQGLVCVLTLPLERVLAPDDEALSLAHA
jgi:two-component sensor histidine kinase